MSYANPTTHNGFLISACACELPGGGWQGQLVLSKCGFEDVRQANLENRSTQHEAEQSALAMGWQLANYVLPVRTVDDK